MESLYVQQFFALILTSSLTVVLVYKNIERSLKWRNPHPGQLVELAAEEILKGDQRLIHHRPLEGQAGLQALQDQYHLPGLIFLIPITDLKGNTVIFLYI